MTDTTNGGFRYPVDRSFIHAVNRVLVEYHPEAEADFEKKNKAREDTSKHLIHSVMEVLSEMASAEVEFEANRTGQRQAGELMTALIAFIRNFPDEWRTSDDKVEWPVSHSRHELVKHVFSSLLHIESLLGDDYNALPADVRRSLTRP